MSEIKAWAEVFKRLPVKTLGQYRCVCKSWDSLIVSPSFIAAHINTYSENEINAFLLYKHVSESPPKQEEYFLFRDSAEKNTNLEASHSFTCPLVPYANPHHFCLIGSVNGLLLLWDEMFGSSCCLFLWNPLLCRYVVLPQTSPATLDSNFMKVFGLGYDSGNADHKVVMVGYKLDDDLLDITPPLVEVYSVREVKWKGVSAVNVVDLCICCYWWSQCFLNGAIHWVSWERDRETRIFKRNCVLLFDVEQQKFKKMKVPEALSKEDTIDLTISEYGGKLSLMCSIQMRKKNQRFDIWVKKEYNVWSSWCKMVTLQVDAFENKGWQCLRRNGEVLGITKGHELASYDPATKETKGLGIHGLLDSWFTVPYSASLSLLDKKSGVRTYNAGSHDKKRYVYGVLNGSNRMLIEQKVKASEAVRRYSTGIHEHPQCGKIIMHYLRKMGGGDYDFAINKLARRSGAMRHAQYSSTPRDGDGLIYFKHYPDA